MTHEQLAKSFIENRERLMMLARRMLNPILLKRMSYEDVLQTAYVEASKRLGYFSTAEDVPMYFKFRTVLIQTITDLSRRHLQAEGRDAYKEVELLDRTDPDRPGAAKWGDMAADITSPASRIDRNERHALLRQAVAALPETDQQIIVLRHFEDMGNADCAEVLGIDPKAASIRYVRALERLHGKLMELTYFRKGRA